MSYHVQKQLDKVKKVAKVSDKLDIAPEANKLTIDQEIHQISFVLD